MEDLNKNQIVLLTLLVSFVTSIATGIITTSLLQEAPLEVTRTINRVVEKTIETVTPSVVTTGTTQKEIQTVVVKEEDSVIDAINNNLKSVVRIKERDTVTDTTNFYGIGLVINKDGTIVADRQTIVSGIAYTATMSDGVQFSLTPVGVDKPTNFILFKAVDLQNGNASSTPVKSYTFVPVKIADSDSKLGQSIISLGGLSQNSVSVGRVVSLQMQESTVGTTTIKYVSDIETDVSSKDLVDGSPLFNLSGDLVGVSLLSDSPKFFTPASILKKELPILSDIPKTAQ